MNRIFEKLNRYFRGLWHLAVLDISKGRWLVTPVTKNISYLKAENANGRHILIQPKAKIDSYYLLIDDLSKEIIDRQHCYFDKTIRPGRMIIETSPNNYQVWIHFDRALSLEEKRYWLKKLHNDPGSDPNGRWGRCPGFRNRKNKYRDDNGMYPLSRLIWIDWKNLVHIQSCYDQKDKIIVRSDYQHGSESETDFSYAMALVHQGFHNNEIKKRIRVERKNWKNHTGERRMKDYLNRTVCKARYIVEN